MVIIALFVIIIRQVVTAKIARSQKPPNKRLQRTSRHVAQNAVNSLFTVVSVTMLLAHRLAAKA
jgi:hypothetical protein